MSKKSQTKEVTYKNGLITLKGETMKRVLAHAERLGPTPKRYVNNLLVIAARQQDGDWRDN